MYELLEVQLNLSAYDARLVQMIAESFLTFLD